jgi:hypothetical protein
MSTVTDIASLKTRCTAIEKKNITQDTNIAALKARIVALESAPAVNLSDINAAIAALDTRLTALESPPEPPPVIPPADILTTIRNAQAGDTIIVPAGTYSFTTRLILPAGVNLQGEGVASWINGPVQVASNATYSDLRLGADGFDTNLRGVSNIVFRNVQFHGGGGQTTYGANPNPAHVVQIGGAWSGAGAWSVSGINFDNCVFEKNVGNEDADRTRDFMCVALKTGVDSGGCSVHDLLFHDCQFLEGNTNIVFEMWQDYTKTAYVGFREINFEGCDFGAGFPCAVDYSGATGPDDKPSSGYSHVTHCTFHGYRTDGQPPWAIVVEKGAGSVTDSGNTYLP